MISFHTGVAGATLKPPVDEDGYEVPMSGGEVEYENTGVPLAPVRADGLSARHSSQSGESCASEKRDSGMQSDDDEVKRKTSCAVANPNYDLLENVATDNMTSPDAPEYVNTALAAASRDNAIEFKDDDIFTFIPEKTNKLSPKGSGETATRTYSEPDSGVGIEVAVDNLLYHKLGNSWTPTE